MIKKTLNSFTENINQKLKNPFLGTFIIIWIIRNWEFVYSLFFFDSETKLNSRIEKIKMFFKDYGFAEILITVGLTFLTLVVTYAFLNLSRLIINFFEKIITPKVYEITDKSSIVLKEDYDNLKIEINRLESKIQDERDLRLRAQNENDSLEMRMKELINPQINEEKKPISDSRPVKKSKADILYEKLLKENRIENFDNLAGLILNKKAVDNRDENINDFTKYGLITRGNSANKTHYFMYELTADGKNLHDRILIES